jgi:Domain of unknown function (DUF4340)
MKLQRTPLVLLLIALGLGGFVYCSEFQPSPQPAATLATAKPIFTFKEQDVRALKMQSSRHSLAFEKREKSVAGSQKEAKDPKVAKAAQYSQADPKVAKAAQDSQNTTHSPSPPSFWQMTAPEKGPANDGQVAFLLNLLATGKSDRSFTIPLSRLAEFGLDQPTATIEVQLSQQKTHKLLLGLPNFDRKSVYAQIDPPSPAHQDVTVWLVPFDFYNAIDRPLSDWQLRPTQPSPATSSPPADPAGDAPPSNPENAPLGAPTPTVTPASPTSTSASPSPPSLDAP